MSASIAWLRQTEDGVVIDVHVVPRASRTGVVGEYQQRLKIKLAAAPVDGSANAALIEFVAQLLQLPKSHVEIVSGARGKRKTVSIQGVTQERLEKLLAND